MLHSTPRLSDVARHVVIPEGIVTTGWPRIEARLASMGIVYDPWQQAATKIVLGKRATGKYAATVGGATFSIPRQVGKTFWLGSLMIAMCVEFPGYRVEWTSHHLRTTTMSFRAIQALARGEKIAPHLATSTRSDGIRTANGEQEIAFGNGSLIMFGARRLGFGRGMANIDVIVFDEAQQLGEKTLEDMVPATNSSMHAHGALLFYIGTPPRLTDDGEAFTNRRSRAVAGKTKDHVYLEFSADKDADPDDRKQWLRANPSYPHRTTDEDMLRTRENLVSDEAWLREGLGVWDEVGADALFGPGRWQGCAGTVPPGAKLQSLAVAATPDRPEGVWSSLVAAGAAGDRLAVVPLRHEAGTDWLAEAAVTEAKAHGVRIAIDGLGPAAALIPAIHKALQKAHLPKATLIEAKTSDVLDACGEVYQLVQTAELLHGDHDELNKAAASAVKRNVRDRWALGLRASGSADISPLEAAVLAAWAAKNRQPIRSAFADDDDDTDIDEALDEADDYDFAVV